jgi:Zn finger protein HypA/HybF involved in hydrogenase expression
MERVTLTAASYKWKCQECGETHYVSHVTKRVTCPRCGAIFEVDEPKHRRQSAGLRAWVPSQLNLL